MTDEPQRAAPEFIEIGPVTIAAGGLTVAACYSSAPFAARSMDGTGNFGDVSLCSLVIGGQQMMTLRMEIPLCAFRHALDAEMLLDMAPPSYSFSVLLRNNSTEERICGVRFQRSVRP